MTVIYDIPAFSTAAQGRDGQDSGEAHSTIIEASDGSFWWLFRNTDRCNLCRRPSGWIHFRCPVMYCPVLYCTVSYTLPYAQQLWIRRDYERAYLCTVLVLSSYRQPGRMTSGVRSITPSAKPSGFLTPHRRFSSFLFILCLYIFIHIFYASSPFPSCQFPLIRLMTKERQPLRYVAWLHSIPTPTVQICKLRPYDTRHRCPLPREPSLSTSSLSKGRRRTFERRGFIQSGVVDNP
jgi:hypothetical protein